jgi:hypothetical protein
VVSGLDRFGTGSPQFFLEPLGQEQLQQALVRNVSLVG